MSSTPPRPSIARLDLADDPERYRRLGFRVVGGHLRVGAVDVCFVDEGVGLVGWGLDAAAPPASIDGIPTVSAAVPEPSPDEHPNGAVSIDHVVLRTGHLDRTLASLSDAGIGISRIRDVPGGPLRQAFVRLGEVVLEVVGVPGEDDDRTSSLWGWVVTVRDESVASAALGDALGLWKDAVQPGRRIATVRREAGVTAPLALMTREP